MSRRIKLATAAVFGILLAIIAGYMFLAARVRDPLQFRLLHVPVFVHSSTVTDTYTIIPPFEMELRNTSSFPIVLCYVELKHNGLAGYGGLFSYVKTPGADHEGLNRYPHVIIAGHEKLRLTYHPAYNAAPDMVADKPSIRYNWMSSALKKLEQGLRKFTPQSWSGHLPLIEVTSTLAPLDVSAIRPPSPPP